MPEQIVLSVADKGWISKAISAINSKQSLRITMGGKTFVDVVKRINDACKQAHIEDLLEQLPGTINPISLAANSAEIITAAVPLTSIVASIGGASGGILGSVLFVIGYAAVRGFSVGSATRPMKITELVNIDKYEAWIVLEP